MASLLTDNPGSENFAPPIDQVFAESDSDFALAESTAMRIEFRPTAGGATIVHDLDVWADSPTHRIVDGAPVRTPNAYRRQASKPGFYWMASVGRHVSFESRFERLILMYLDWMGTVVAVLPQPFVLHFERTDRPKRHIPDFLIEHGNGTFEVVDVKGALARDKALNRLAFTLTGHAAKTLGWAFTVATELAQTEEFNLRFLAGYRTPRYNVLNEYIPELTSALSHGPLPVGELLDRLSRAGVPSGVAPAVLWRATWFNAATVPIDTLLSDDTPVSLSARKEASHA